MKECGMFSRKNQKAQATGTFSIINNIISIINNII